MVKKTEPNAMQKIMDEFPQRLKGFRVQRKLTQQQLAHSLKMPAMTISHYECGRRFPGVKNLMRIAVYLSWDPWRSVVDHKAAVGSARPAR